jgi:hypothetical protein
MAHLLIVRAVIGLGTGGWVEREEEGTEGGEFWLRRRWRIGIGDETEEIGIGKKERRVLLDFGHAFGGAVVRIAERAPSHDPDFVNELQDALAGLLIDKAEGEPWRG